MLSQDDSCGATGVTQSLVANFRDASGIPSPPSSPALEDGSLREEISAEMLLAEDPPTKEAGIDVGSKTPPVSSTGDEAIETILEEDSSLKSDQKEQNSLEEVTKKTWATLMESRYDREEEQDCACEGSEIRVGWCKLFGVTLRCHRGPRKAIDPRNMTKDS